MIFCMGSTRAAAEEDEEDACSPSDRVGEVDDSLSPNFNSNKRFASKMLKSQESIEHNTSISAEIERCVKGSITSVTCALFKTVKEGKRVEAESVEEVSGDVDLFASLLDTSSPWAER